MTPTIKEPLLDIYRGMVHNRINYLYNLHEKYGDTFEMRIPFKVINTRDPEVVKHVLHKNWQNYPKKNDGIPIIEVLFKFTYNSNNIFFTPNFDLWKQLRTTGAPSFLQTKLREYVPQMINISEQAASRFENAAVTNNALNIRDVFSQLTLKNVLYNLFDDCEVDFEEFHHKLMVAFEQIEKRGNSLTDLRWLLPTKDRKEWNASIPFLQNEAHKIIQQREKSNEDYDDLLNNIISTYKSIYKGEELTQSMIGEMLVYLIAGHDTTASTINAVFKYLSLYPEVEERVLDEIDETIMGTEINFENVEKLKYTKMVFFEALRLQTPVPLFFRKSIEDDEVAGHKIPANTFVSLNYFAVNRNINYWDNPEAFDPERFREKRWGQDEQYAYVPFGGGPRMCLGMNFAILEALVALTIILPKYRATLVPGRERKILIKATTWPGGADEMIIEKRS